MRWSKLDWFNIIKQLFIMMLGCCLLRMGIIMLGYYGALSKALLLKPWEIAALIIAGRLFEHIHSRFAEAIQRRLTFFFCILVLALYGMLPAHSFGFDFSSFVRLVTVYASFVYGASVNRRIEHYDVLNRLKIYTALLALLSFFVKSARLFEELFPVLFMYIILSLIILAFYNVERVNSAMPEHYAGSMRKRWIWLSVAVSILLSAGAGLIFSAYNPFYPNELFNMIKHFYNLFVDIFIKIITPVVAPIIYVFGFIINILKRLARLKEPEPAAGNPGGDSIFANVKYRGLPPAATSFFKIMIVMAIVAAFAAVLLMVLRKLQPGGTEDVEEIRESVFEWQNAKKNVIESIRRLMRMRRKKKETVEFSDAPAFRVRRLYVNLLRKVKEKGCVREPAQTPMEFASCIIKAYGQWCGAPIRCMTEAYIRARYYPQSVTKQDEEMAGICLRHFIEKASGMD